MNPRYIAVIFAGLGLLASWSMLTDLRTGVASSRGFTFTLGGNPIMFLLVVASKIFIIGFSIAEMLHGFGLAEDPVQTLRPLFEPFRAGGNR